MARSVERTLDIMEALAASDDFLSLSELRRRVGISPATAHRLLGTLKARGYATQDEKTRHYGPGAKLLEVAARATSNGRFDLRRIALPCLRRLTEETGETSNLVLPAFGGDIVYLEQVRSPRLMRIFTEVGHRAPLYCTAAGKAILSRYSPEELRTYIEGVVLEPMTARTITSRKEFSREIDEVRRLGFAIDDEERAEDVRCASAPLLDSAGNCIAAISVSGPSVRISVERAREEIGPMVRRLAVHCSEQLGYHEPAVEAG